MLAVPAVATDDDGWDDHAVTQLHLLHLRANLDDLTHELVADHVSSAHRRDVPVDEVQIGATGRGQSHSQDGILWIDDLRVGDGLHPQVVDPVPAECAHGQVLLNG
jgi:hypothetical protein